MQSSHFYLNIQNETFYMNCESLTQRLTRRENAAAASSGVNYNELDYDSEGKEVARL